MPNETILIVEDDQELRPVIAGYLRTEGYAVLEAADGEQALRLWAEQHPHLILLDWMLGGLSGLEVARRVRAGSNTPIIMLTARNEDADVILGLEVGADDYLVKPVSLRQVAARIRAVLRRSRLEAPVRGDRLAFGDLQINFAGHTVTYKGAAVPLTATQFKVLAVLVRNPHRVFSRMQLMEAATGDYYDGYERTIDSHISHLRRKLGADELIQTVHGIGYKLVPPGE